MTDGFFYQLKAEENGFHAVCGIDEAGRGPLAGPVCAAAVILPADCDIDWLDDSKKLSEAKRETVFGIVKEKALSYGIGWASEQEIDEYNILQATFLAMCRAVEAMTAPADYALVDGNRMPPLAIPGEAIVRGDSKCTCIAAASILAKVSRDRKLRELDAVYPEYGFAKHKGYGTKAHYEAIKQYGVLPIHRRSFLRNLSEK